MSDEIKERFVILRQLDMGKGFDNSTIYGAGGSVSGRVLDIVKNELLLHLPDLDQDQVDEIVNNVVGRLYRPEVFDFDKAQEADEYWKRGMFRAS
jgi:hypothetical protein